MKKLFLLGTATLLFTGLSFAQTGAQTPTGKNKGKAKDSTHTTMKPCPGKTCGKKKS